jgi:hypothetical protein
LPTPTSTGCPFQSTFGRRGGESWRSPNTI